MKKYALLTVSFNNSFLLKGLLDSLNKLDLLKEFDCYLIDNSSPEYNLNIDEASKFNFNIIDNRLNQLKLNFNQNKRFEDYGASKQHSQAIQKGFDLIENDQLILLDTDTYVRKNFIHLFKLLGSRYSLGWRINKRSSKCPATRLHPCFELFNLKQMKLDKVKYHTIDPTSNGLRDTGSEFYRLNKSKLIEVGELFDFRVQENKIHETEYFYHLVGSSTHNPSEEDKYKLRYESLIKGLKL